MISYINITTFTDKIPNKIVKIHNINNNTNSFLQINRFYEKLKFENPRKSKKRGNI